MPETKKFLYPHKVAEILSVDPRHVEALHNQPGHIEVSPYLEASMFAANKDWAKQLFLERKKRGVSCKWRVESRVDKLNPDNIPYLAKAGLKVIDLGLESACYTQLYRMKKTQNAEYYLKKARKLIEVAHDNGIWLKVNILLYAGEDNHTIEETTNWLSKVRCAIKGSR